MLVAVLLGTTFGHALEMPMKMNADGRLWMTFQHTLYPYFAYVGAPVEIGSILSLGDTVVFRAAAETAKWTADTIPSDWADWRRQWEYSHLARFVLHLIGFAALGISLVLTSPEGTDSIRRSRS